MTGGLQRLHLVHSCLAEIVLGLWHCSWAAAFCRVGRVGAARGRRPSAVWGGLGMLLGGGMNLSSLRELDASAWVVLVVFALPAPPSAQWCLYTCLYTCHATSLPCLHFRTALDKFHIDRSRWPLREGVEDVECRAL